MPEEHCSFEEPIAMVDSNEYQTSHPVAGGLTLVLRGVARKVAGECLYLRFEVEVRLSPLRFWAAGASLALPPTSLRRTRKTWRSGPRSSSANALTTFLGIRRDGSTRTGARRQRPAPLTNGGLLSG